MATSVDQKLLRTTKFPPEFSKKVDINKVNVEVIHTYDATAALPHRSLGESS